MLLGCLLRLLEEVKTMAYIISDDCISCGACEAECPVGAISEGDGKYQIDPETCIECGACEGVCPSARPNRADFQSVLRRLPASFCPEAVIFLLLIFGRRMA